MVLGNHNFSVENLFFKFYVTNTLHTVSTIHKRTYNLICSNQDNKDNTLKCIT
jgi:hypothetical protein